MSAGKSLLSQGGPALSQVIPTTISYSASILFEIAYGHKMQDGDDYMKLAEQADEFVQIAASGAIIDLVPPCMLLLSDLFMLFVT